jgi:HTH-type transcriptional regulator/antitoxin HigA
MAKPHVLRNEAEYNAAVAEIDRLLDAEPQPGSEDYERLECLSVLVQAYEDAHLPMGKLATPQDVVEGISPRKTRGIIRNGLSRRLVVATDADLSAT